MLFERGPEAGQKEKKKSPRSGRSKKNTPSHRHTDTQTPTQTPTQTHPAQPSHRHTDTQTPTQTPTQTHPAQRLQEGGSRRAEGGRSREGATGRGRRRLGREEGMEPPEVHCGAEELRTWSRCCAKGGGNNWCAVSFVRRQASLSCPSRHPQAVANKNDLERIPVRMLWGFHPHSALTR